MNDKLSKIKELLNEEIDDKILINVLFEMNRYFDKHLKDEYKKSQKENNMVYNTYERKNLRYYYYYGHSKLLSSVGIEHFGRMKYSEEDINNVLIDVIERLNIYEKDKIIGSILKKCNEFNEVVNEFSKYKHWLNWHNKNLNKEHPSLIIIRINQEIYDKEDDFDDFLANLIRSSHEKLNNYRYMSIIVDEEIYDRDKVNITWKLIYKASLYAENFVNYEDDFFPFKQNDRIKELSDFLLERGVSESESILLSSNFYKSISTGFKFEDCYVDDKQKKKILVFKKIELDNKKVPCPSCLTEISSGNSFPEMFLRSWECKNPTCPNRSKSGRGKRFDEFGVYRYFKMIENNKLDVIEKDLYTNWRRDVFKHDSDEIEMLLKYYSWSNELVFIYNTEYKNNFGRVVKDYSFKDIVYKDRYYKNYNSLPIVALFKGILNSISKINNERNVRLTTKLEVINDDSKLFLNKLNKGLVGSAVTSPPYYNAREYSQWGTLLLYLVDMMLNAKAVYDVIINEGVYLYNIGDIVSNDNIYVKSHMSNRRLMLGNYSMMIFEIIGFHLAGNIIWDKGEVQSKRNSTVNMFPTYVKCINCYEHVLIFSKKITNLAPSESVVKINPVIKINSKGVNTYKHTAPYPLALVELVKEFSEKDKYVLDPYLGSGTTLLWCKNNDYLGLGIEMDLEYYKLSKDKIFNTKDKGV